MIKTLPIASKRFVGGFTRRAFVYSDKIITMRLNQLLIALSLFVFLASCGTDEAPQQKPETSTNPESSQVQETAPDQPVIGQQSPEKAEIARQAREKFEEQKQTLLKEKNNTTSPYKYIITNDSYSIFASMVKKSTVSKHIHGGMVTLLAPKNRAFDDYPNYANLLKDGNESQLDEFINHYILDKMYTYKAIKAESTVETHAGIPQKINDRGGITVGGASISQDEVFTSQGNVIGMNELYFVADAIK